MESRHVLNRIEALEAHRTQQWVVALAALLVGMLFGAVISNSTTSASAQARRTDEILTVRGLIVVDEKGVERVRIGSPLPDPMTGGKRVPRKGVVSGILISDSDGDERGGYVTSDTNGDAFLTLDAKTQQQALFLANRDGGANLALWSGSNRNANYVSVRAVPNGLIEIVKDGKTVFIVGGPDVMPKQADSK